MIEFPGTPWRPHRRPPTEKWPDQQRHQEKREQRGEEREEEKEERTEGKPGEAQEGAAVSDAVLEGEEEADG